MKARIKFEIEVEYEMCKEHYPEGSTPEQMLEIDLSNADEDPFPMIAEGANWKITGEIVNQDNS